MPGRCPNVRPEAEACSADSLLTPRRQAFAGRRSHSLADCSASGPAVDCVALDLFPSPGVPDRDATGLVEDGAREAEELPVPAPLGLVLRTSSRPTPPTSVPPGESNIVTDGCSLIALLIRLEIREESRFRCSGARPLRDSTRSPGFLPALSQTCFRPAPSPSPRWAGRSPPIPPHPPNRTRDANK
jgi:hypothetical protein